MRMTCDDALLLISSQLDGQLSDTEQAQLQTHLEQCAQCRALMQADKMATEFAVRPQDSALDTLLYQMLRKNWQPAPDEPLLMRLALEMDDDAARCRNALSKMEELLPKAYAQALRENRQSSALTAIARLAVHYKNLHHL